MDLPAVRLLLLDQGDRSHDDHTSDFLDLACLTYYPALPMDSPQGSFAANVELVLVQNDSLFTIFLGDEANASPTLDPERSQPSTTAITDQQPEPGTEPLPESTSEPNFVSEPEPSRKSDQVQELATPSVPVGVLME